MKFALGVVAFCAMCIAIGLIAGAAIYAAVDVALS